MDLEKLRQQVATLSEDELLRLYHEFEGGRAEAGELPLDEERHREAGLDSPFHFATETLDPFYKEHFEPLHARLLDECLAPWTLGETVRIDDVNYNPSDYVGLIVTWPRSTFKSSCLRCLLAWAYPYFKLRLEEDLTCMFCHQIQAKAIDHGEGIRNSARYNQTFRARYREYAVPPDRDWDSKDHWRWPNMHWKAKQAGLWSFVAYGESSSKVGGHYKLRLVDDWEDEETVGSTDSILSSERKFKQIDNLKILGRDHNPWIVVGTYYHYDGVYKRLERSGGWLNWRVPAHDGSPKAIFDLIGLDRTDPDDLKKIKAGIEHLERTRHQDLNFPKLLPWQQCYMAALGQMSDDDGEFQGGHYMYSCQQLLDPVPAGQARFDHDALQSAWFEDLPGPEEMWLYVRIDPAIGTKKRNCDTAVELGGVMWNKKRLSLHTWIGKEKRPTKILRRTFAMIERWQSQGYIVKNIGIEAVAFQEAMAEQAQEGIPAHDAEFPGQKVPIVLPPCDVVKIRRGPDATKHERIIEMDGPVSRREVGFWVKNPGAKKLHQQFCHYPHGRLDGLEAFHDLWKKTAEPPRPLTSEPQQHHTPEELLKRFGIRPKREATMGLQNHCVLANWRS